MRTQHGLLTFLAALVMLPIGAWFALLLLPAIVLLIPILLICGVLGAAALILSALHSGESMANVPGPPALNKVIHAI